MSESFKRRKLFNYYNFKSAARKVILPEYISPLLVILLSGLFVAIWSLKHELSPNEVWTLLKNNESFVTVPMIFAIFASLDFVLSSLLFLSISKLNSIPSLVWIFLQIVLCGLFILTFLICPYTIHLLENLNTWGWLAGSGIILIVYKLYRIRIIMFLIEEIKEESHVWNEKGCIYSYE